MKPDNQTTRQRDVGKDSKGMTILLSANANVPRLEHVEVVLTLRAANQLTNLQHHQHNAFATSQQCDINSYCSSSKTAYARDDDVHGSDRLAVRVQLHVERLDVLGVVTDDHLHGDSTMSSTQVCEQ